LVIELLSIGSLVESVGAALLRSGAGRTLNVCNPARLASGATDVRTWTPDEHAAAVNTNALVMLVSKVFERIHPPD
jgi:hypothetical protein